MLTKDVINISPSVESGTTVNITARSPLYAGASDFKLGYKETDDDEISYVYVDQYHHITFENTVKVISLEGDAYIATDKNMMLEGQSIASRSYLPLPFGTRIFVSDDTETFTDRSHLEIRYYDDSVLDIDFRKTKSYYLYDL